MRIGFGYDAHKLIKGRKLILGGVQIQHEMGLLGHSDADVLTHAIIDALIGAIGEGDIGKLFPDSDVKYKDISSIVLLKKVYDIILKKGYKIVNIDCTVVLQRPKILPFVDMMKKNISDALNLPEALINIKGKTTEGLGFEGREEGVCAYAVALLDEYVFAD